MAFHGQRGQLRSFVFYSRWLRYYVFLLFGIWLVLMFANQMLPYRYDSSRLTVTRTRVMIVEGENGDKFQEFIQIESHQVSLYHIILFWTPYFGAEVLESHSTAAYQVARDHFVQPMKRPRLCNERFPKCLITSDRIFARRARTVVFHWRDFSSKDLPDRLAGNRSDQLWALYNLESPQNTAKLNENGEYFFDLMANYRHDADIHVPYGRRLLRAKMFNGSGLIIANRSIIATMTKKKPVAWLVSNCQTQSRREEYAAHLAKEIEIDVYGQCGPFKCGTRMSEQCYLDIARDYYFYLSFENSLCVDYVTEKAFSILQYNLVPIVYGGADYAAILPPGSYIDARQYKPAQLAVLLKEIMADRKRYENFFAWRKSWTIEQADYNELLYCELCKRLAYDSRTTTKKKKTGRRYTPVQVNQWYFGEGVCFNTTQI